VTTVRRVRRLAAAAAAAALACGCATLEAPFRDHLESATPQVRECAEWFQMLDARVDATGVRDAQDARLAGFPYLRSNRLLASLRPVAELSDAALRTLVEHMQALDIEARRYEIMNLPAGQIADTRDASDRVGLRMTLDRTRSCAQLLRDRDLAQPETRQALLQRAAVPDDYRTLYRILGLYPATRFFLAAGVRRYEEEARRAFLTEPSLPPGATLLRLSPPSPGAALSRERAALILARAAANPLGIPQPGEPELQEFFAAYAPSFEIAVRADYDRIGAVRWLRGGMAPEVDGAQQVVYAHPAWTRYRDRVLLQLVYTVWFPERPPQSEGDIFAGKLDGITWRVTLAPDGAPLLYDTIHPCGCYHLFFPTPRAQALPAPGGLEEWMFSPQSLPNIAETERPLVRIASGTHFLEKVSVVRGSDSVARYELRPYDDLRSVQRLDGGRASMFDADGLVPGSERPERSLFWPSGIVSAGAMRQWGRHATAFVGRRHFDDADLLEKRFRLDLDGLD
jgi:hypothetical protein